MKVVGQRLRRATLRQEKQRVPSEDYALDKVFQYGPCSSISTLKATMYMCNVSQNKTLGCNLQRNTEKFPLGTWLRLHVLRYSEVFFFSITCNHTDSGETRAQICSNSLITLGVYIKIHHFSTDNDKSFIAHARIHKSNLVGPQSSTKVCLVASQARQDSIFFRKTSNSEKERYLVFSDTFLI